MSISFDAIPNDIIEGGLYTELRSTGAGVGQAPHRALIVVPKLSGGTLSSVEPQRVVSRADAYRLCGQGSLGAAMIRAFMAAAPRVELYALGFSMAGTTAKAATGTIGVDADEGLGDGTIALYVAGERIEVPVSADSSSQRIVNDLVTAMQAAGERLPVDCEADVNGIGLKVTACDMGTIGNQIDLRINYYSTDGRAWPRNLSVTINPMAGGAGSIPVSEVIDAIAGRSFDTIVWPDSSTASLAAMAAELKRRFTPLVQQDGHLFAAVAGSVAAATSAAFPLNCPHVTVVGTSDSRTPACVWAAVLAAVDAAEPDSARPRRTLELPAVKAPTAVWDDSDRRSALWGGVSTWTVDAGGNVLVDRLITTYRVNADGLTDSAYREVTTLRTLTQLWRRWHARIRGKYPRHKLADDSVDYPPGQAIVQPKTIRAESIALHREWEQDGLVQRPEQFAENLIVERHAGDPNRLDVRMRVSILGKFLTLATSMEFEH